MKTISLVVLAFLLLIPSRIIHAQSDINLTGYSLAFSDEFNTASVTTSSPKGASTWYYLPPYGSAGYYSASTWDAAAFTAVGGILYDKAFLDGSNNWHSGNISSIDPTKAGFSQQYGYFEIRCQMPNSGSGAWPAFWLETTSSFGTGATQNEEIDIFEWYGVCNTPGNYQAVMQQASHNWNIDGSQNQSIPYLYSPGTPMPGGAYPWQGYHIYGCQIDPVHVTWYIDGVQTNQIATPTSYMTGPFYVMVDYALGGGWPLDGMVNNSTLNVDWVRVYSLPTSGAPAAPTSLTATAGNAQNVLNWTASSGAMTYNVYRGTTAGGESATAIATGITGTTYTNTGLTNGTTYYYKVAAVNASGTSGYSNEASATPSAGGGGGSATFANASFETPAITGYSYSPTGSSWTFTNNAGIQHNGSAYGATNAPDGTQTGFVQGISSTLGTMSQSVNFPAGTYTISFQGAQRYSTAQPIKVSVDSTVVGTYTPASNSFALITTGSFTVAAGNHTITFAATDNTADKSSFIDLVSISAGGGGGGSAPAAPTGLASTAGNAQVTLNWTASSGATSYNVYRGTSSGGESATAIVTGITGTTYTNMGLTNGTAYFYKVAAVNSYGTSGYSNETSATPAGGGGGGTPVFANASFETPALSDYSYSPAGSSWTFTNNAGIQHNGSAYSGSSPLAPDGVQTGFVQSMSGTLGTMSQSVSFTAGTYTISFYAAQRYATVQPVKVTVDGNVVGTYSPASGSFASITTASFTVTAGSHTVSFAATDNSGDKTSFIDLVTINVSGGGGGSVPATPTGLTATAGNAQVALSWTASSGAMTYNVYRGTTAGGESGTPIVTGVTGTTYTNTGLSNGTAYYYKVAAVNGTGTSGYSNEASATPSAGGGGGGSAAFANASFETPSVSDYTYSSTGTSWTFTNNAGIQHNGSAYSGSSPVAPDGVQTGFVQGISSTLGSMSQSVTFPAGTYTITFYAAQRYGAIQPVKVTVDGNTVGTYSPPSGSFTQITTASFTVAAGAHTVTFAATDSSGDKSSFIDLVSIH